MRAAAANGCRGEASGNVEDSVHGRNVMLLPQAVDQYQRQLAALLEGERYGEAWRLLDFLLQCGGEAIRWHEEWRALKEGLEKMLATLGEWPVTKTLDDERGEEEWLRDTVNERASADRAYAEKLIAAVTRGRDPERQLAALSQLRFVRDPDVPPELRAWLSDVVQHPIVQFRALQVLRAHGQEGYVAVRREGGHLLVNVDEVPLRFEDFPPVIRQVQERVRLGAETVDPSLAEFADNFWKECVQAAFGTSAYARMTEDDGATADIWAAALHRLLLERLHGNADDGEVRERYGITDDIRTRYAQALQWLNRYADNGQTGK